MTPSLVPAIRSRSVSRALFVSGVVVLVLLFVLPIEVQETVEVPGRVLPAQEWVVVRNSGGALSAIRRDYRTGAVEATFTAEPARGDAVQFELGPAAAAHAVAAGDTVGFFASGETALRMATLRGAVDAARAELRLYQSGEKASLVEAARQDFRYAQTALEQATREADRQCSLAARGVVTEQACEDAGSARRLAAAGAAAAEARLEAVRTGARAEAITLARTRLASLEQEAATLAERFEMGTLVAPISGMTYRVFSPDTLLMVADTSAYTVVLPIRWSDRGRVTPGQEVVLRVSEWGEQPHGRIVDLRETAPRAAGQTYVLAAAEVTAGKERLKPGLLVRAVIETESVSLLGYARQLATDLFRW